MIIDKAIDTFMEKYDRDMMDAIDYYSSDPLRVRIKAKFKVFNLNESFNIFKDYINGYGDYKIKFKDSDEATSQDVIRESVNTFIETKIFEDVDILYSEIPEFIESYIVQVKGLIDVVDHTKDKMMSENVDYESIGDVNEFTDAFMLKLNESFDECMERLKQSSGYNTRKKFNDILNGKRSNDMKKETIVFL